jgi:hypothetical protein
MIADRRAKEMEIREALVGIDRDGNYHPCKKIRIGRIKENSSCSGGLGVDRSYSKPQTCKFTEKTSGGGKAGACTWLNDYVYEFDLMSYINEDVEIVSYVESDMAVYEDGHWKFKNQFGDCYRQILSKQIQID